MKKIKVLAIAIIIGAGMASANPVTVTTAKKVAENFYVSRYSGIAANSTLAYTERDINAQPVFYVFNLNTNKGFVIVTAEDAASPIIGYSDEGSFTIPSTNNNVYFWLQYRKNEILAIRSQNISATSDISNEWISYTSDARHAVTRNVTTTRDSVLPLCKTTWDQGYPYNAMCPGTGTNQAITGCVATAMAQIMRYWSYPGTGTSSSCYYDQTNQGYTDNYGELCAYYDTTHYKWSEMPYIVGSSNYTQVAKLMYDCGVSVAMDYTPTGSGAEVMGGFGPSAYNSYTQYFGYDANTINTQMYSSSQQASWISLLESELKSKRIMQFEGTDPTDGGHSWVCDGFSAINMMHMNWGWSGTDDGYYTVTSLNPSPFDFSEYIGVIYGIQPPPGALGVQTITDNNNIKVYPNPSHGVFNFDLTNTNGNYEVSVYNTLGQEVNTAVINTTNNEINLGIQPKGIYIYKMVTEKGQTVSTGRLIVE
ncbi:MAG TPA: thiol protease/hemagglutinin PrtT [Bacteroidia bacterium]|jgi:hypothetical protein|nr:thiol protease/hemagglutinin PrtT [Bacteroidia bacterium]